MITLKVKLTFTTVDDLAQQTPQTKQLLTICIKSINKSKSCYIYIQILDKKIHLSLNAYRGESS